MLGRNMHRSYKHICFAILHTSHLFGTPIGQASYPIYCYFPIRPLKHSPIQTLDIHRLSARSFPVTSLAPSGRVLVSCLYCEQRGVGDFRQGVCVVVGWSVGHRDLWERLREVLEGRVVHECRAGFDVLSSRA